MINQGEYTDPAVMIYRPILPKQESVLFFKIYCQEYNGVWKVFGFNISDEVEN